ncbi:tyrosyl-dna phosphodiesterase domain-containing protein [Colletotrichum plurivorum]|uniref:Tyrosyl-dna phosphodiesterase domain-containing protein n=1 Tax=Colletotrichum plurivorum TaxID=2175906 RepID=A0A8H6JIJ6_9PEZI|nr:tyrosyl-dna phosphodiesterase domain-containing protein [Colletotrichum plurivorum]
MNQPSNPARSESPDPEYDSDLALAIALSLQQEEGPGNCNDEGEKTAVNSAEQAVQPVVGPRFGSLALDRKKMEEDRIARLNKRSSAEAGLDSQDKQPKQQRYHVSKSYMSNNPAPGLPNSPERTSSPGLLPFPRGVFKQTWASGHPRTGQDIKIEEVLQKDKLQLAMLSSFQWDEEWLLSKLDYCRTKTILVAYARDDAEKAVIRANAPNGLFKFCFPPMHGGYMHSKLQILKFEGYLRVVIPSGNLVAYDWGETGVLENMVFLIDLPRLDNSQPTYGTEETFFGRELRRFLRALGLEESLVKSLDNYDFSETRSYGFVHSISGSHANDSWQYTGYCGLGSTVRSLGLATDRPVDIDYVASSLGSLSHSYLKAIYNACQGDSGMKEFEARQSRSNRSNAKGTGVVNSRTADTKSTDLEDHFRIYFPSEETILGSRGGRSAAGTICMQEKWWKAATFPRELLRDCEAARHGLLLHSKAIFVQEQVRDGTAWAYVGSANLSESAWGRLVKDRESGKAKLSCRNWECGVLVAVGNATGIGGPWMRRGAGQDAQAQARVQLQLQTQTVAHGSEEKQSRRRQGHGDQDESASLDELFGATIPIPMKLPARRYKSDESAASRPWFF